MRLRQELREVSRQCLLARNSCKNLPIDGLDRKTANDMRLRLTPAMPHIRGFFHEARSRNNARELRNRATSDVASRQMPRTTSS